MFYHHDCLSTTRSYWQSSSSSGCTMVNVLCAVGRGENGRAPRQSTRSWRDAIQQYTTKNLVGENWERWNNILELCTESRFLKKQSAKIQIVQQVEISRETNQTRNGDEYCNSWWNLICVLTVCPCKAFLDTGHMNIGERQLSLTCFYHHHH